MVRQSLSRLDSVCSFPSVIHTIYSLSSIPVSSNPFSNPPYHHPPANPCSTTRGEPGEEVVDENFNFANARRRSNSSGVNTDQQKFKTKFDINEQEPVFEEDVHGPADDDEAASEDNMQKTDSSVSENSSVDEPKANKA